MSTSLTEVTNLKDKIKTNAHFDKTFKMNENDKTNNKLNYITLTQTK